MITVKMTARCDVKGCRIQKSIDPNTPQPYVGLVAAGWTLPLGLDAVGDFEQHTICPEHSE